MNQQHILDTFQREFGTTPLLVHAPGRVNLIGEHTDYNEGFVFPAAIDKGIMFGIGPTQGSLCRLIALDMKEEHQFDLNDLAPSDCGWANYLIGVCAQLQEAGHSLQADQASCNVTCVDDGFVHCDSEALGSSYIGCEFFPTVTSQSVESDFSFAVAVANTGGAMADVTITRGAMNITAVQVALLTVYDMCKAVDRGMTIGGVGLLEKSGGKSGHWRRDDPNPD